MRMIEKLTRRQKEILDVLPASKEEIIEELSIASSTIEGHMLNIREALDDNDAVVYDRGEGQYIIANSTVSTEINDWNWAGDEDLTPVGDPDPDKLTKRERYIVQNLQQGSSFEELSDDLDERRSVIAAHLRNIKEQGWQVYIDQTTDTIGIEGDEPLRSSEHTGTRTRIANRWWQMRHNELVRSFKTLDAPVAKPVETDGSEDWVTHLTDLHAGDEVRGEDGELKYSTKEIPDIIEYVTEQALNLSEKHGSEYDRAHLLWGGDFITNEGIYSGQFEDLDAWLDEQHDTLIDPLVTMLKAFSRTYPTVNVVCQVGNHGNIRANGTSKQANSDLILYKSIRNVLSQLQGHGVMTNVSMQIGQATAFRNFPMRDGKLRGHLRHGQNRRPQAETSAREKEWVKTLLEHDFDVACMGHWHISGRIPWDGPPVICSASPKPASEFIEEIGGRIKGEHQDVATCFGVSDKGITSVFPIDTRNY
jgi:DNA-binding CsgD family transcriptional regulator